ncbi:hypothetical protein FHT32_006928 [Variovorax sp. SG517]|uniref:hypothetical protein n=1 Tax=Variovorax sp. SG517 TaxID=2587117 RepID=UPI00159D1B31|nr:hypothetical protein [Variovorax sp. SG517]NVM93234.1 hypothetical protein [Variovorax sp. SG517]
MQKTATRGPAGLRVAFVLRGRCRPARAFEPIQRETAFLPMTELTMVAFGTCLLLLYLAWRERVVSNDRDAGLLAGVAACAGVAGIVSLVV